MSPTIDERIATMIRAVETIILPALAQADSLAREQAGLLVGHLRMLRAQVDHAIAFDRIELRDRLALAGALLAEAAGGPAVTAAADALAGHAADAAEADTPAQIRTAAEAVGRAIEALVPAARTDGAPGCLSALSALILDHAEARTTIDRAWFAGAGFDPDPAALPPIDELMRRLEDAGRGRNGSEG